MAARDGGCVFPECDRPTAWCEAHHLTPWSHGGRTDVADGCLLCSFHHHLVHQGQREVRMGADGIPEILPPARIDPPERHDDMDVSAFFPRCRDDNELGAPLTTAGP